MPRCSNEWNQVGQGGFCEHLACAGRPLPKHRPQNGTRRPKRRVPTADGGASQHKSVRPFPVSDRPRIRSSKAGNCPLDYYDDRGELSVASLAGGAIPSMPLRRCLAVLVTLQALLAPATATQAGKFEF